MIWSIRLKFLIVMCGLLTACLGVYLLMAMTVFKADKIQLVFDLNRSQVSNLASELETQFGGVSDKLKLFSQLPVELQSRMAEDLFSQDSEIVSVHIFSLADRRSLRSFTQSKFLETYGLENTHFENLTNENAVPFGNILQSGQDLWNASLANGPPMIGYGRLVVLQDKNGRPVEQWAVVGFVKLDRFLKSVSMVHLSQVYVANRRGEVLVHPDAALLLTRPNVLADPLFQDAIAAKTKVSLVDRELPEGRVLAAYAQGFDNQILVVAKAGAEKVFRVVKDFAIRTLLFALVVLTLVVLAAFMLSRSLTENIAILANRMTLVSKGDLISPMRLKSRDETRLLADTFNQMILDLKTSRDDLEELNRDLDQKVKDRTLQLEEQNKKVKEVQEALIRTTRLASVGEIAGRTAHEVLNPLTILLTRLGLMQKRVTQLETESLGLMDEIRLAWKKDLATGGFAALLKSWNEPSKVLPETTLFHEDLENLDKVSGHIHEQNIDLNKDIVFVKQEGERIGKIINAMRRLGQFKSEAKAHSLHEVLTDCCHIMSDLFSEKHIAITQNLTAADDVSLVDRDEMVQALTNLMRNSLYALDHQRDHLPSSAALLAMTVRTYNEGEALIIEIEDNGIGIPVENQARLFDSSFTTKSTDEGTGLGLGISRRFVRSFGGNIEFTSSIPGQKTVFRVQLPINREHKRQGAVA